MYLLQDEYKKLRKRYSKVIEKHLCYVYPEDQFLIPLQLKVMLEQIPIGIREDVRVILEQFVKEEINDRKPIDFCFAIHSQKRCREVKGIFNKASVHKMLMFVPNELLAKKIIESLIGLYGKPTDNLYQKIRPALSSSKIAENMRKAVQPRKIEKEKKKKKKYYNKWDDIVINEYEQKNGGLRNNPPSITTQQYHYEHGKKILT